MLGDLPARADAELAENLAQVKLDSLGAQEELGGHFPVGQPGSHQTGDRDLMWREANSVLVSPPPGSQATGRELALTTTKVGLGAQLDQVGVSRPQLRGGGTPTAQAAQEAAIGQLNASLLEGHLQVLDVLQGPHKGRLGLFWQLLC